MKFSLSVQSLFFYFRCFVQAFAALQFAALAARESGWMLAMYVVCGVVLMISLYWDFFGLDRSDRRLANPTRNRPESDEPESDEDASYHFDPRRLNPHAADRVELINWGRLRQSLCKTPQTRQSVMASGSTERSVRSMNRIRYYAGSRGNCLRLVMACVLAAICYIAVYLLLNVPSNLAWWRYLLVGLAMGFLFDLGIYWERRK